MIQSVSNLNKKDIKEILETGFEQWKVAVYGKDPLKPIQLKQIRQAFFSGVFWMSTERSLSQRITHEALAGLLGVSPY